MRVLRYIFYSFCCRGFGCIPNHEVAEQREKIIRHSHKNPRVIATLGFSYCECVHYVSAKYIISQTPQTVKSGASAKKVTNITTIFHPSEIY